jgi:hypothetical protein
MALKSMPATPMTQEEMEQQCSIVSAAAQAADHFSDDELESCTSTPAGEIAEHGATV